MKFGALIGLVNTGLSLIKDKTHDADTSFIQEKIKNGVSISSKRMLNLGGTFAIITYCLSDMSINGITMLNLILLGIGVAYSLGMSFITKMTEKK